MRKVVADLETDGLLPELTKVHSLVIGDLESDEIMSCADQEGYPSIEEGLAVLAEADRVYFHNAIGFDIPAIRKVYGLDLEEHTEVMDTLVLARTRFAHVDDYDYALYKKDILPGNLIGSHKLEAWGYRLEVWKSDYDGGWDEWSPAMQQYCEQDVVVTRRLVQHLAECGLPARAVEMEHKLARYLQKQEENGWPFNVSKATKLQAKLAARRQEIEAELVEKIGWWWGSKGQTNPKQDRTLRKNFDVPRHHYEGAPYTRLEQVTFNPGSRQHIAKVLMDRGWEPEVYTPNSGQPKVSEEILSGIDDPIAEDLVEYLTIKKRLGQIAEGREAWLRHTKENEHTGQPHIHHRCYQNPRTHRQAHSSPNLAQVPKNSSPYGEECRALFEAPEGWSMLGTDVSGLELRTVAHYMTHWDNGAYGEEVVEGDVHTRNQEAVEAEERDDAKTFIYAYLYGAGDEKLGRALLPAGATEEEAKARGSDARSKFESKFPALGYLTKAVKSRVRKRGYVQLIDGRRAYPRSNYAALNTLIQGTGAIVCKAWLLELADRLEEAYGPQGWDGEWAGLGFIHDELQLAAKPEIAEDVGEMSVEAIKSVARDFDFTVPLDADYDIGANWSETH